MDLSGEQNRDLSGDQAGDIAAVDTTPSDAGSDQADGSADSAVDALGDAASEASTDLSDASADGDAATPAQLCPSHAFRTELSAVVTMASGDVWVAMGALSSTGGTITTHGCLLRRRNNVWTLVADSLLNLNGVFEKHEYPWSMWSDGSNLWVGTSLYPGGRVLRYGNGAWSELYRTRTGNIGPGGGIRDIWARTPNELYALAAGLTGTRRIFVVTYNGTAWVEHPRLNSTYRSALRVRALGLGDVWVIGSELEHDNGSQETRYTGHDVENATIGATGGEIHGFMWTPSGPRVLAQRQQLRPLSVERQRLDGADQPGLHLPSPPGAHAQLGG